MTHRRSFLATACVAASAAIPAATRAAIESPTGVDLPAGARVPKFKFVYECEATLSPAIEMGKTVPDPSTRPTM